MLLYLARRILAIIPTLLGITVIAFIIINLAPGGPIEQKLQQMRFGGGGTKQQAVTQEVIDSLNKLYGFDKPVYERYFIWLKNLAKLDFGQSFTYEEPVMDVIVRKMPVSLSFGLVSFILSYLICIPLGIVKALKNNSLFDRASSSMLFVAYSIPGFMLAILLIVLFGGGSFWNLFPITGAISDNYESLTSWGKFVDRVHHMVLPLICYVIGSFTTLTLLMKNSLLEEIKKDYVRTARSKGLGEKIIIGKHALRNALIPIATGFGDILTIFFAGSLLIETIFSLDGMGLLSYQSVISRDYNVIMGLLVIQSGLYLVGNIISDFMYVLIDPRIDFSKV